MVALSVYSSGYAYTESAEEAYTIVVNDKTISLDDLPFPAYKDGETLMIPLRKIGEALGYKVEWNPENEAVTIDDEYIQKATLFDGTAEAVFEGRLKVIDMSREIENEAPTAIRDGYTYVPLSFFKEFLNDTVIENGKIIIAPSKYELQ